MKWAVGILGAMLYVAWPYYSLLDLSQAVRAADAQGINRLVDWESVRPSLKAQLQAEMQSRSDTMKKASAGDAPFAALGNALALTFINSMIDQMLTPQGVVNLIQGVRGMAPAAARTAVPSGKVAVQPVYDRDRPSLWKRMKYAFFISPIHFRLDLAGAQPADRPLTVMLTFKGTGWQVTDVRLPASTQRVAQAPNHR